jgi:hypothetical protein
VLANAPITEAEETAENRRCALWETDLKTVIKRRTVTIIFLIGAPNSSLLEGKKSEKSSAEEY